MSFDHHYGSKDKPFFITDKTFSYFFLLFFHFRKAYVSFQIESAFSFLYIFSFVTDYSSYG
ncbi:MAG: hypothetical protein CSB06_00670 [Bacteroidia bacterium]|nr:MAG: hypothetical protein CSB06_00670 [Bacteroidia bacterium]